MKTTLSFSGTVSAGGELVISSHELRMPYKIISLHSSFALGCDRTTQIRFFLSPGPSEPTSGHPDGTDLLEQYSKQPYLIGDDERKDYPFELIVTSRNSYIKVHALNSDVFDHTVDCQVVIDMDFEEPS